MRAFFYFICVLLSAILCHQVFAQTIDVGRGAVPLVVPSDYDDAEPAPLVVLLHGYTENGSGQDAYMKISPQADTYGFLFIAPNGTREPVGQGSRFWNATDACCNFYGSDVDDSGYIRNLIDEIKGHYSVDENRVYLIGHSNGGFMSYRMAVDHPDTIAAIASLAGAAPNELSGPKPEHPVSILQIHGTEDQVILYDGGWIGFNPYPGAVQTVEKWAEFYELSTDAVSPTNGLDLDDWLEGDETTITQYGSGLVELWTIDGGGHIPVLSNTFANHVIEWLMAHPKPAGYTISGITLTDAILVLRYLAGMETFSGELTVEDINQDGKIGLAEAIYVLERISGLRN